MTWLLLAKIGFRRGKIPCHKCHSTELHKFMKRGVEFHIKLQNEDFTLAKRIRESLDGEQHQISLGKARFYRKIREKEVVGESIRGRRKFIKKVHLV